VIDSPAAGSITAEVQMMRFGGLAKRFSALGALGALVVAASCGGGIQTTCDIDSDCEDGIVCTLDQCVEGTCQHSFNATEPGCECEKDADCADTDPCTSNERCDPVTYACKHDLVPGPGCPCELDAQCMDADPCTLDTCIGSACMHDVDASKPECAPPACTTGAECDDADPCTLDACIDFACVHDVDPACNPGPFSCADYCLVIDAYDAALQCLSPPCALLCGMETDYFESIGCGPEGEAYFGCRQAAPIGSWACLGGPGMGPIDYQGSECDAEQAALDACIP
jgi:hypothetical protein